MRGILQLTCSALFLVTLGRAQDQANGVKVGEVDAQSAVVWTRTTRAPERNREGTAVPRDLKDLPADVELDGLIDAVPGVPGEVRLVYGVRRLGGPPPVMTAWIAVDPARDFTHQFHVEDLTPGTGYFVRCEARPPGGDTVTSRVGAVFRTAALPDQPERVQFTVVTGQAFHRRDMPTEGHRIYGHMAALEPHFFVHTGDVVYYDKPGPLAKDVASARYKWNRMYALPLQREFHRRTSCYFLQDDHDVLKNDCWPGQTYGALTWEQGLALFDEQTPAPATPYRRTRWGADLEVWLLEGREFRSSNREPDGPAKTILGEEQRRWLEDTLRGSNASFRIVISATPIVGPDRSSKNDNHANEGYRTEGEWLRKLLASQEDTFSVCGDRHWQYVSKDPATGLVEFSCGPTSDVHAGGFGSEPREMHRYLRVKGGFLSVTVAREWGVPVATFRHHDVRGRVTHTERVRSGRGG
jgi:alkaline phosphatase D